MEANSNQDVNKFARIAGFLYLIVIGAGYLQKYLFDKNLAFDQRNKK